MLIARAWEVFTILFPIFAVVLVGYVYARKRPVDMSAANRLNLDVFTPALLFSVLSAKDFDIVQYQWVIVAGVFLVIGSGVLGLPFLWLAGVRFKTFIPTLMYKNTGNMGIPVTLFAFGEEALSVAVVLFVVSNLLQFTVGMSVMNPQMSWWHVLRMNMILATLLAVGLNVLNVGIPPLLLRPLEMLGQMSVPLMLFSLGVRLTDVGLREWRIGLLGAVVCPLVGLAMFAVCLWTLPLTSAQIPIVLIYSVLPPAVFNYMVAEQYQQEPEKVASIVMLGNVLSLLTMPTVLFFALGSRSLFGV